MPNAFFLVWFWFLCLMAYQTFVGYLTLKAILLEEQEVVTI